MSQAFLLRLDALEQRVALLEAQLAGEPVADATGFRAKHFGFGRWKVVNFEGVGTGDQWLEEADAKAQATELNAALEGMEAA